MTKSGLVSFALGSGATAVAVALTGVVPFPSSAPLPPTMHSAPALQPGGAHAPASFSYRPIEPGDEPIQAIPPPDEFVEDYLGLDIAPARVELGRRLFHDPRLSVDDSISCSSCHDLRYAGIDRAVSATGVGSQVGPINTPTVFNAVFNVSQFWNGRAETLEDQADGPPNAVTEMASDWKQISAKLGEDQRTVEAFSSAFEGVDFGKGIDGAYIRAAIADFERTLITPDSPFDHYLSGDVDAVSEEAKQGYQVFKDVGCIECHNGMSVGSKSFQVLGRKQPYSGFDERDSSVDLGRFLVTGREADRHAFKVPSLRNVALTAPYFHDGSQATLQLAIRTMARTQLDLELSDAQVDRIEAFLVSLTGSYQGVPLDESQNSYRR